MSGRREYIVTLKRHTDLDRFYDEMETTGGGKYIPNRAIPCKNRRPVSRNTHYLLDANEAERIKKDPRVLAVELTLEEQGAKILPLWTQTSSLWNKSNTVSSSHRNWGLFRSINGTPTLSWGYDGTTNASGTVSTTSSGKHVDVVIVDGIIDPSHPEFAVNSNGSGGSRVVHYNWFQLNSQVTGSAPSTYVYPPYVDATYPDSDGDGISDRTSDNDHGCHVAGIAVGNTCGWARDANIYNISPYSTSPSVTGDFLDYIKVWHQNKPTNPVTGRKNPTITNHSYGVYILIDPADVQLVAFRGTQYTGPFTESQLKNYGIAIYGGYCYFPLRSSALEADLADLMDMGVIVVGASGNEYAKIDEYTTDPTADYYNYLITPYGGAYYHRGSISAAPGVICVGAIDASVAEGKAQFSNCGPRVDIHAPGRYIMSPVNSTTGITVGDSRNPSYRLTKKSGTSMASPQVTGVLACLLEQWPTMSQAQAVEYLENTSKDNQVYDSGTAFLADYSSLQGSPNKFLYYNAERPRTGQVLPNAIQGNRPSNGMVYPRSKIYRYGR